MAISNRIWSKKSRSSHLQYIVNTEVPGETKEKESRTSSSRLEGENLRESFREGRCGAPKDARESKPEPTDLGVCAKSEVEYNSIKNKGE